MTGSGAERFRREADECLRQAAKALSPLDKQSWSRMAKEWTKLAKDAEQRGQSKRRPWKGRRVTGRAEPATGL
jgi:hypothetical protein